MEEKSAPVEQITAPVEETPTSRPAKKDPKKVAAGKALARRNKEAREAQLKLDGRKQVFETLQYWLVLRWFCTTVIKPSTLRLIRRCPRKGSIPQFLNQWRGQKKRILFKWNKEL